MSLLNLNIPASTATSILDVLTRIAIALERIAGPEIKYEPPTLSTQRDCSYIPPEEIARMKEAEESFAAEQMLVPGSQAYLQRIAEFERAVADSYGEDAVNELPWRAGTR